MGPSVFNLQSFRGRPTLTLIQVRRFRRVYSGSPKSGISGLVSRNFDVVTGAGVTQLRWFFDRQAFFVDRPCSRASSALFKPDCKPWAAIFCSDVEFLMMTAEHESREPG